MSRMEEMGRKNGGAGLEPRRRGWLGRIRVGGSGKKTMTRGKLGLEEIATTSIIHGGNIQNKEKRFLWGVIVGI